MLNSPVEEARRCKLTKNRKRLTIKVHTFTLCDATEMARISEHVVQGDLSDTSELVFPDLAVHDRTATLVKPADYSACMCD